MQFQLKLLGTLDNVILCTGVRTISGSSVYIDQLAYFNGTESKGINLYIGKIAEILIGQASWKLTISNQKRIPKVDYAF